LQGRASSCHQLLEVELRDHVARGSNGRNSPRNIVQFLQVLFKYVLL
jgi:hypothetical protein